MSSKQLLLRNGNEMSQRIILNIGGYLWMISAVITWFSDKPNADLKGVLYAGFALCFWGLVEIIDLLRDMKKKVDKAEDFMNNMKG